MRREKPVILIDPYGRLFFVLCCLALLAIILGPELFGKGKTKDYELWFRTGQAVLNGVNVYAPELDFQYPPFTAILLAPLAVFGKPAMYGVLWLINVAAWVLIIQCTCKICSFAPVNRFTVWLPSLLMLPLIAVNFDLGQPNILLLALVLIGFALIKENRSGLAGGFFGLAAAIKVFPIVVLPYLIVRREFKAAAATLFALVLFSIAIPFAVFGPQKAISDLTIWSSSMIAADENKLAQRPDRSWNLKNQSLISVVHRLTRHVDSETARKAGDELRVRKGARELYVNVIDAGFEGSNLIYLGTVIAIGIAFLMLLIKTDYSRSEIRACELGILVSLIVIASPVAYDYYFVWWLFPISVLLSFLWSKSDNLREGVIFESLCVAACIALNYSPFRFFSALGCMLWGVSSLILLLRGAFWL